MKRAITTVLDALRLRPLLLAALVLPVMIFVVGAWIDYSAERRTLKTEVQATASALSEHAQAVLETADLVIDIVLDRTRTMGWDDIQFSPDLHAFLSHLKQELPQLESVFLVAPDGRNVATTRAFPLDDPPGVADRAYFQAAANGMQRSFVSSPFEGKLGGSFAFTITRPLIRNGTFDGLAGITMSPDYLERFYQSAQEYPGHSVTALVREDGSVLFRTPATPNRRLTPVSSFYTAKAENRFGVVREVFSPVTQGWQLVEFTRLDRDGVYVGYGIDDEVYLRPWRRNAAVLAASCALLGIVLLLTERIMIRRGESALRASAALLEETERRRKAELALEQMAKMEALGRLTGGVAHDFNNLLTAILGPLDLASRRITDAKVLRLLAGASEAAQRAAKLTAQMLAFARNKEAVATVFDPNLAIRECGEMIGRTIGPRIELRYSLDEQATPVSADLVQFEMTLLNLCVNARDAMPEGGMVELRTRRVRHTTQPQCLPALPPGEYVEISACDDGEGMPDEVRLRALEPFFTTKGPGHGTGLGLSAAYGFARSAGGGIAIASAPGRGTTVTLFLPLAAGTPVSGPAALDPPPSRPLRILLVDDDPAVRDTTRALLVEAGHDVTALASATEALELLRSGFAFDLLVTDVAMPVTDGGSLAEDARQITPGLPVLFITGYAKDDALVRWEGRDARTLDKPYTGTALLWAVQETVAQARVPAT